LIEHEARKTMTTIATVMKAPLVRIVCSSLALTALNTRMMSLSAQHSTSSQHTHQHTSAYRAAHHTIKRAHSDTSQRTLHHCPSTTACCTEAASQGILFLHPAKLRPFVTLEFYWSDHPGRQLCRCSKHWHCTLVWQTAWLQIL
jgi:hypothetical protein